MHVGLHFQARMFGQPLDDGHTISRQELGDLQQAVCQRSEMQYILNRLLRNQATCLNWSFSVGFAGSPSLVLFLSAAKSRSGSFHATLIPGPMPLQQRQTRAPSPEGTFGVFFGLCKACQRHRPHHYCH